MRQLLILFLFVSLSFAQITTVVSNRGGSGGGGGGSYELAFVAADSANISSSSDIVINVPSGTSDGDIMIAALGCDTDAAHTVPTGWTLANNQSNSSSRLDVMYRVASSEPASYNFGNPGHSAGVIATFEKTGGTWNIADNDVSTATSTSITSATVTATDNSILVFCVASDDPGTLTAHANTTLAGYEYWDASVSASIMYVAVNAGNTSRSCTFSGSGDLSSVTLIIEAE